MAEPSGKSEHSYTSAARWAGRPLAVLFVLAVPLCLIGNNVRWVTLDRATYRDGFEKYRATARTGLDAAQLDQITTAFIEYFEGSPGRLNPTVTLEGAPRPLFNEREVAHMEDVQRLMQAVFSAGHLATAYLAIFGLILLSRKRTGIALLGKLLLGGAGLSVGLLLAVALLSLADFSELFLLFHQLSFRNDLWMLDPSRDYLLMLFPQGFWFDVALKIAGLTALEAVVLGTAGYLTRRAVRRVESGLRPAPQPS